MTEKVKYYWNKKGETFAGCKFGDDVTKYFENDEKRCEEYLNLGKIVTSEPIDFDHAKEDELNSLRVVVEKLQSRNSELEENAKKSGTAKWRESQDKIKELESQLEEATAPKGKK